MSYYKRQLERLRGKTELKIKLCDTENNQTNWLNLNRESIAELNRFFLGVKVALKQDNTRCMGDELYNHLRKNEDKKVYEKLRKLNADQIVAILDYFMNELCRPDMVHQLAKLLVPIDLND